MPVRRKARPPSDGFLAQVRDYLTNRTMRERSEYHEGSLKKQLMDILAKSGTLQEGGHRTIELDQPEEFVSYKNGKPVTKQVVGIERKERAGTMALNHERTIALLKKKDLMDRCTEVIVEVNEDEVLAANYDGTITDKELDALYDKGDPTYAFYLMEDS